MFDSHFRHMGRGFGRFAPPFERHLRMFKRGDLKYVVLSMLKDQPSHGYELTQQLEERFHGMYSPSTGSIYPVLQLLEDMEYVTAEDIDGKKVYTITDAGKKFLEEQKDVTDRIEKRLRGWWGKDRGDVSKKLGIMRETFGVIAQSVSALVTRKDHEALDRVNEILVKTREEIESIVRKSD